MGDGRRISELRPGAPEKLPRRLLLYAVWVGCTTGCTLGVSLSRLPVSRIISRPWRRVIMSRMKQATAEAAEPFSFEVSKRRVVASPAAWAARAIMSEVLAA